MSLRCDNFKAKVIHCFVRILVPKNICDIEFFQTFYCIPWKGYVFKMSCNSNLEDTQYLLPDKRVENKFQRNTLYTDSNYAIDYCSTDSKLRFDCSSGSSGMKNSSLKHTIPFELEVKLHENSNRSKRCSLVHVIEQNIIIE